MNDTVDWDRAFPPDEDPARFVAEAEREVFGRYAGAALRHKATLGHMAEHLSTLAKDREFNSRVMHAVRLLRRARTPLRGKTSAQVLEAIKDYMGPPLPLVSDRMVVLAAGVGMGFKARLEEKEARFE